MKSLAKKSALAIVLVVVLSICGLVASNAANPVGTARFAVRASAMWQDIWPFPHGGGVPFELMNLFYYARILKPVRMKVEPGFLMELDARDLVTRSILLDGVWEPRITGVTLAVLQEGSTFIDVGAHVGYYSLLASTQVGPAGRVIAIEPNPHTLERLWRNIRLNNSTNIAVEEVACTEKEGPLQFFQAGV
jgi:hypothetical protein